MHEALGLNFKIGLNFKRKIILHAELAREKFRVFLRVLNIFGEFECRKLRRSSRRTLLNDSKAEAVAEPDLRRRILQKFNLRERNWKKNSKKYIPQNLFKQKKPLAGGAISLIALKVHEV